MATYLLNGPVLTDFGVYQFAPVTPEEARWHLADGFLSAVGHPGVAQVLTELLGLAVPVNRAVIAMVPGDKAVVFWLRQRPPAGGELSEAELWQLPFRLGLLTRVA